MQEAAKVAILAVKVIVERLKANVLVKEVSAIRVSLSNM